MCVATRYPEAVPLRTITAPVVVRALVTFFSTFGIPKVVQMDQGTNFPPCPLHIGSLVPITQSQAALEHWHQTLKSVLPKYCVETRRGCPRKGHTLCHAGADEASLSMFVAGW